MIADRNLSLPTVLAMLVCAFCATSTVFAVEQPGDSQSAAAVTIVEHGLYSATLDEQSGQASAVKHEATTTSIAREPGTVFGFRYRADNTDADEPLLLEVRLEHPPLIDPESGETLTSYSMQRQVQPGVEYVQLQQLPDNAPAGDYRFSLRHQGNELASQAFSIQGQANGFTLLEGELQARCRSLAPDLGSGYGKATLLSGHTFALRLPPGAGLPASGDVCFLALETDKAQGLALSDMQGKLLAPIQPLENGLQILAVSFPLLDDDQLPEIIVVARNAKFDPPLRDSRVYFAVQRESGPAWGRRPDLDKKIARTQSAHQIKRWLQAHAALLAPQPVPRAAVKEMAAEMQQETPQATGEAPQDTQVMSPGSPPPEYQESSPDGN